MYGYCGKLLHVDLSSSEINTLPLQEELMYQYIGGSGVAAALYCQLLGKNTESVSPLGPDNPLIFMTGPLSGSGLPASGRMVACAKSPLTGNWSESNAGGFFAAELKRAGFDGIIISGSADEPVSLHIHNGKAELRLAAGLWGQDSYTALMLSEYYFLRGLDEKGRFLPEKLAQLGLETKT
jgi:aldehyde:ferredoxin oxidoreductase